MPHVAFDPTITLKPILTARSTPDRGAAPAFESLLDSAPPVDRRPADNNANAARADRDQPAAKSDTKSDEAPAAPGDDAKTADAKTSETKTSETKATDEEKPAGDGKSETKSETEAKAEGKSAEQIAAEAQLVVEAKPATTAVVAPAAPIPTLTPADAIATAVPAAAEAAPEAAIAAPADAETTIGKGKSGKTPVAQAEAGKAGDEAKGATEFQAAKSTGDKPLTVDPVQADKAEAGSRGEVKPAAHAVTAETTVTPAADATLAAPKADAAQVAALTAKTTAPATPLAAPAPLAPQAAAVPLSGIAIEITSKALSSTNHFEIRLDPPELGRIEVRLEVDRDGTITTRMIADRPETLDLLRRDSAGLERAMQDAGLKTSDNGTQFSLRDQSMNQQQQSGTRSETAQLVVEDEMLSEAAARDYSRLAGQRGGVDIRV